MMRPHRCLECGDIFFAEKGDTLPIHGRIHLPTSAGETGYVKLNEGYCFGHGEFAGLEDWEMDRIGNSLDSRRYESLNEGHNWERTGMLNPHTLPLRDTPQWDKYVREGRIAKDDKGRDCLVSKDKKQWAESMRDLGYATADGAGEVNKSRQQGEHLRDA